jgi:hypothetical protein
MTLDLSPLRRRVTEGRPPWDPLRVLLTKLSDQISVESYVALRPVLEQLIAELPGSGADDRSTAGGGTGVGSPPHTPRQSRGEVER